MSYNRANKLRLIANIQAIYLAHKKEGVSTVHIYRTCIYPVYHIGLRSFYNYLAVNVKQEQKKIADARTKPTANANTVDGPGFFAGIDSRPCAN